MHVICIYVNHTCPQVPEIIIRIVVTILPTFSLVVFFTVQKGYIVKLSMANFQICHPVDNVDLLIKEISSVL
jgi:hypothetical protein